MRIIFAVRVIFLRLFSGGSASAGHRVIQDRPLSVPESVAASGTLIVTMSTGIGNSYRSPRPGLCVVRTGFGDAR